jgi:hypothetical protein
VGVLLRPHTKEQNGSRSNSRPQDVCRIDSLSLCSFHKLLLSLCDFNLLHCGEKDFLSEDLGIDGRIILEVILTLKF